MKIVNQKIILILTNSYPYCPGEQFLEDEIIFWGKVGDSYDINILPTCKGEEIRQLPKNIKLQNKCFLDSKVSLLIYNVRVLFSKMFFNEFIYLYKSKNIRIGQLITAVNSVTKVYLCYSKLHRFCISKKKIDIVYSYWNTEACYAACMLKIDGLIGKVISRAHRYDLYEDRRKNNYMPLKRQFVNYMDSVYCISKEGKDYFLKTYGEPKQQIEIRPLGVPVSKSNSRHSPEGKFHIVSVSFCVRIKRIDKIIGAISSAAKEKNNVQFIWSHIGNGPLVEELRKLAKKTFGKLHNVSFDFLGNKPNSEVKSYYLNKSVDCFINASESEGIPVSIMEAMSCGVPAIAPNVGGISDLVSQETGVLMKPNPHPSEIAASIIHILNNANKKNLGINAKEKVKQFFNSEINYESFVQEVVSL